MHEVVLDNLTIINHITSGKDVDGLNDLNAGRLTNNKDGMVPCTAAGIIRLLEEYEVPMEGANVVIVGRSKLVGKPLISLFLKNNATVTVCHSKTENIKEVWNQHIYTICMEMYYMESTSINQQESLKTLL